MAQSVLSFLAPVVPAVSRGRSLPFLGLLWSGKPATPCFWFSWGTPPPTCPGVCGPSRVLATHTTGAQHNQSLGTRTHGRDPAPLRDPSQQMLRAFHLSPAGSQILSTWGSLLPRVT